MLERTVLDENVSPHLPCHIRIVQLLFVLALSPLYDRYIELKT